MRRAARIDDNQSEIVSALRRAGVSVTSLAAVGMGCPDILCGHRGQNFMLEIKDGSKPPSAQKLTPMQERWQDAWQGQFATVNSIDAAFAAIGLEVKG